MQIIRRILDSVLPRSCCICGDIANGFFEKPAKITLSNRQYSSPFCKSCSSLLEGAYGPWIRKEAINGIKGIYLFDYSNPSVKSCINHMKRHRCKACTDFFVNISRPELDRLTSDGSTLCFIPRSRGQLKKYRFDQSERIIMNYLKNSSADKSYASLFLRGSSALNASQKELDTPLRMKNAQSTLFLKSSLQLPDSVVLFDDMVTSGATALTATSLLKAAGVKSIKLLFLAGQSLQKNRHTP